MVKIRETKEIQIWFKMTSLEKVFIFFDIFRITFVILKMFASSRVASAQRSTNIYGGMCIY